MVSERDRILRLSCVTKDIVSEAVKESCADIESPCKRRLAAVEVSPESATFLGYYQSKDMSIEEKPTHDLSKALDVKSERRVLRYLSTRLPAIGFHRFTILTEELGVMLYGCQEVRESKALVLIDPIDSTDLALMHFGGAIAVTVALVNSDKAQLEIVTAAIGSIAWNEVFWASSAAEDAYVDYGIGSERLQPNFSVKPSAMKLSTFAAKLNRLDKFPRVCSKKESELRPDDVLLDQANARVLLHHGGPLPICRVAAGDIDAVVEFAKGYKCIDYAGALFIAKKARAEVRFYDEHNKRQEERDAETLPIESGELSPSSLKEILRKRQKFICAANNDVLNCCERFFTSNIILIR